MAIIKDTTGDYDDKAQYTAGELCGDHWWVNREYVARAINGRVDWEVAINHGGSLVRLERLTPQGARVRYVDPDTLMVLVRTRFTRTADD